MLEDLKPHIAELRDRLIKCVAVVAIAFFACFSVWEPIMAWVTMPLKEAIPDSGQVVAVKMGEQFFTAVSVSFFASLVISLPVIFYQLWAFLAPGLYEHEKKIHYAVCRLCYRYVYCRSSFCILFCLSGRI